jgi:hypothetical protein
LLVLELVLLVPPLLLLVLGLPRDRQVLRLLMRP